MSTLEPNRGQINGLPANPRSISEEKFEKLKHNIKDYPEMLKYRSLMVFPVDNKYVIIGGNMRYEAMKQLGYNDVPCIVLPKTTTVEQLKAYVILDNNEFGKWDWDMLANEWDEVNLQEWGIDPVTDWTDKNGGNEGPETTDEDNFDEQTEEIQTICKFGDIWKLGQHILMCGDSTDTPSVAILMGDDKADMLLTDPPYNVAVKNSQGMTIINDNMNSQMFCQFLTKAFAAASAVMTNGCPFYVWFASKEHINFEEALMRNRLIVRQELVWNKNQFILGRSHYQWKHEPCLYGWKGNSCKYFTDRRNETSVIDDVDQIKIDKMKKEDMRVLLHKIYDDSTPVTVINENKPNADSEHPTMKPVRLFGRIISNSSRKGDIVLDTFGGSGTTIIACEQLERKSRIMELDPHYCDVIIARWQKFTGKTAERLPYK